MRRIVLAFTVAVLVLGATVPAFGADTTVTLTVDQKFLPADVTIPAGGSVSFVWEGGFHNVKFDDGAGSGDPVNQPGKTWSRAFPVAGTFHYICEVHAPNMAGTIKVAAASAPKAETGPQPSKKTTVKATKNTNPKSYPTTGAGPSLLPIVGGMLVVAGAGWHVVRNRSR